MKRPSQQAPGQGSEQGPGASEPQAQALARFLKRARSATPAAPIRTAPPDSSRQRAVGALEAALEARSRRGRRAPARWLAAGLVASSGLAAGWLLFAGLGRPRNVAPRELRPAPVVASVVQREPARTPAPEMSAHALGGEVLLVDPRGEVRVGAAVRVAAGQRLVTRRGAQARVDLPLQAGFARARLAERSDVSLLGTGPQHRLFLVAGRLDLEVPHLARDERLVVSTVDTEVEVRGTRFRVEVLAAGCGGRRTRISVLEGQVDVRQEGATSSVHPGEVFSAGCDGHVRVPHSPPVLASGRGHATAPAASALALPTPETSPRPVAAAEALTVTPAPSVEAALPSSTLWRQNALYAAALAAARAGDRTRALQRLDELERGYPEGPLGEVAAVERLRLLGPGAPADRRAAARAYLRRFPDGFARAEAERALAGDGAR